MLSVEDIYSFNEPAFNKCYFILLDVNILISTTTVPSLQDGSYSTSAIHRRVTKGPLLSTSLEAKCTRT